METVIVRRELRSSLGLKKYPLEQVSQRVEIKTKVNPFVVKVINYSSAFLLAPYIWGGKGPIGFDCSGFIIELYKSVGMFPHTWDMTSQELFNFFSKKDNGEIILEQKAGALVFYGRGVNDISHIALALDDKTIREAGGGNSKTVDPDTAALRGAFVRDRPTHYRNDFCCYVMPVYPES